MKLNNKYRNSLFNTTRATRLFNVIFYYKKTKLLFISGAPRDNEIINKFTYPMLTSLQKILNLIGVALEQSLKFLTINNVIVQSALFYLTFFNQAHLSHTKAWNQFRTNSLKIAIRVKIRCNSTLKF